MFQLTKNNKIPVILSIFVLLSTTAVSGYIMDVPPKPAVDNNSDPYLNDFIVPRSVEIMQTKEIYQFVVIISMLLVNLLIMYLMYLNARKADPNIKFDMQYLIYAIFGVIIGFNWFVPNMSYQGTYPDVFFSSAAFALAGEGLVSKVAKAAKSLLKNQNGNGGVSDTTPAAPAVPKQDVPH